MAISLELQFFHDFREFPGIVKDSQELGEFPNSWELKNSQHQGNGYYEMRAKPLLKNECTSHSVFY